MFQTSLSSQNEENMEFFSLTNATPFKMKFSNLYYPPKLIDTTINKSPVVKRTMYKVTQIIDKSNDSLPKVMFSLPFVDQKTTENTRRQLQSLSSKIGVTLQPVFSTMKVCNILKTRESKPKIVNQQCVVYHYKCGLCEMDYVDFTNRHLYQRINEHTSSTSSVGKLMKQHGLEKSTMADNFSVSNF